MKRLLCIILALMMGLSLCACGKESSGTSKGEKLYKKYKDIITLLEDEDYDGAIQEIEDLANDNEKPTEGDMDDDIPTAAPNWEPTKGTSPLEPDATEPVTQDVIYIFSGADLFSITDSADKTYILANDIDLSNYSQTLENFYGILDGNGKDICNSTRPLIKNNHGVISNITVVDCNIQLEEDAAAISIYNEGTINNCSVTGQVSSKAYNAYAAGITCYNNATVDHCTNQASIYAESWQLNELGNVIRGTWACAGGIVAQTGGGKVTRCVNTGTIHAEHSDYVSASGGIIAQNGGGEVTNCYNAGTITCDGYVFSDCGGIAGHSDSKITNCYNVGQAVGAIVGDNRDYIIDCYYLDSASTYGGGGNEVGERIYSFSSGQLTSQSTFSTFDFDTVWIMTDQGPQLR